MRKVGFAFSLIVALVVGPDAHAAPCIDYPYGGETVPDLIRRTSQISLARVTSVRDVPDNQWSGDNVEFHLVDLGTIKGRQDKASELVLPGIRTADDVALRARGIPANHNNLSEMGYRVSGGQGVLVRRKADNSCMFVPILEVGKTYLVFTGGGPSTSKSFEEVPDFRTDGWYRSVLQELAYQLAGKGH